VMVSLGAAIALRVGRPVLPSYPTAAAGEQAGPASEGDAGKKADGLDLSDAGLTANLQLGDVQEGEPTLEPVEDGSEDGPKLEMVEEQDEEGDANLVPVEDDLEEAKLELVEEPEQDTEAQPAEPEQEAEATPHEPEQEAEAAAPETEPDEAAPPEAEPERENEAQDGPGSADT